ncbi:hypothetical protein PENSPDRAFT_732580 [Peniophora sp. CONT]|nr:hypothetical protein PENSPDRAFT_732580 [Peniophora sp. CONT]
MSGRAGQSTRIFIACVFTSGIVPVTVGALELYPSMYHRHPVGAQYRYSELKGSRPTWYMSKDIQYPVNVLVSGRTSINKRSRRAGAHEEGSPHHQTCANGKNIEYFIQLPNLAQLWDLPIHRLYRTTQADARLVQPVLRAAARFPWHLRRKRGHGRLRSNVVVQVFKTEEDEFGDYDADLRLPFKAVGGDLLSDGRVKVVADRKTPYGIHVTSKFNVPLHIWAFYFDCSDLSITEYYKPAVSGEQAEPSLPARGTITLGYGASGGRPYRYYLREDTKEDIGFIRLFVSTEYIDLSHIQQVSPFSADDPVVAMDSASSIEVDVAVKRTAGPMESGDRAAVQAPPPTERNPEGTALVWDVITIAVIQAKPDSKEGTV